jgi:hypothetical protein
MSRTVAVIAALITTITATTTRTLSQ